MFTPADLGNWSRYSDFTNIDTFRGKFILTASNVDDSYVDALEDGEKTVRDLQDRTVRLLFIYQNHALAGVNHNMRFWRK